MLGQDTIKSILNTTLEFVKNEISKGVIIYPEYNNILISHQVNKIPKVVIIAQDPYYSGSLENNGYYPYATGIGFESNTIKKPQSLYTLQSLMCRDEEIRTGNKFHVNLQPNNLTYLLNQNVMLTNLILTVEHGKPYSHSVYNHIGKELYPNWEAYTEYAINYYSMSNIGKPMVFMLFGNRCSILKRSIYEGHLVIEAPHPARTTMKAFASIYPFYWANEYLRTNKEEVIQWTIP